MGNQRPCRQLQAAPLRAVLLRLVLLSSNNVAATSGWSLSGPSAYAAATTRSTTTAAPWGASLALETRSLALEWPSLGLGSG